LALSQTAKVVQNKTAVDKHDVLNGFCVVSEQHLNHILKIGADWYNKRRGHSGRDHLPPIRDEGEPPKVDLAKNNFVRHTELGGHLKSYRAAA
jgi:putative transposase